MNLNCFDSFFLISSTELHTRTVCMVYYFYTLLYHIFVVLVLQMTDPDVDT